MEWTHPFISGLRWAMLGSVGTITQRGRVHTAASHSREPCDLERTGVVRSSCRRVTDPGPRDRGDWGRNAAGM
jgi:hypothetical protein